MVGMRARAMQRTMGKSFSLCIGRFCLTLSGISGGGWFCGVSAPDENDIVGDNNGMFSNAAAEGVGMEMLKDSVIYKELVIVA